MAETVLYCGDNLEILATIRYLLLDHKKAKH